MWSAPASCDAKCDATLRAYPATCLPTYLSYLTYIPYLTLPLVPRQDDRPSTVPAARSRVRNMCHP